MASNMSDARAWGSSSGARHERGAYAPRSWSIPKRPSTGMRVLYTLACAVEKYGGSWWPILTRSLSDAVKVPLQHLVVPTGRSTCLALSRSFGEDGISSHHSLPAWNGQMNRRRPSGKRP